MKCSRKTYREITARQDRDSFLIAIIYWSTRHSSVPGINLPRDFGITYFGSVIEITQL